MKRFAISGPPVPCVPAGRNALMKILEREVDTMYGAILGDIIGSPYEFDRGSKTKDFPLFSKHSSSDSQ